MGFIWRDVNPGSEPPKPMPTEFVARDLECIEADARRALAKAAAINVRGFDTLRDKREALAEADRLLEEYNEAVWLSLEVEEA